MFELIAVCDKCEKSLNYKAFKFPSEVKLDDSPDGWEVRFQEDTGVGTVLLCQECRNKWRAVKSRHQDEILDFFKECT